MESITNYRKIKKDKDCIEYIKKHRSQIQEEIEIKRNALQDTDFIKYIESELRKFSDRILELRRIIINPMITTNRIVYININSLENIIELYKAELESVNITQNKLSGFKGNLTTHQAEALYNSLKGNYIDSKTKKKYFIAALMPDFVPLDFEPIIWIKKQKRNWKIISKKSLINLLTLAGINKNEKEFKDKVNKLFAKENRASINLSGANIYNNKSKSEKSEFYSELENLFSKINTL